jgi:hypothetical protein
MSIENKPKSRFELWAPQCAKCRSDMTMQSIVAGKRKDLVGYCCKRCGKFANRMVRRPVVAE